MWSVQEAKNRLSAVIAAAIETSPQVISRRGKPSVVVLSVAQYERLARSAAKQRGSFIEHLLAQPREAGNGEEAASLKAIPRDLDL